MSFDEDFEELAGLAYRAAYRILGERALAEDIAQEALAKAFARWDRVGGHARAWVCRVATNEAISEVRRRARRRAHTPPLTTTPDDGGAEVLRLDLQRALLELPRRQRDVVALRFIADLTETEVAESLGISLSTVKTHARRGLDSLRGVLGPGADPDQSDTSEETHNVRPA